MGGYYYDTIPVAGGCDSLITLELQVDTLPSFIPISQRGDTLYTLSGYEVYSWYQDSATLLATGSDNSYIISHAGNYYVTVSYDSENCLKSSAVYAAKLVGIENVSQKGISPFIQTPPPARYFSKALKAGIKLKCSMCWDKLFIRPQLVSSPSGDLGVFTGNNYTINLSGNAKGMYFYRVTNNAEAVGLGKVVLE